MSGRKADTVFSSSRLAYFPRRLPAPGPLEQRGKAGVVANRVQLGIVCQAVWVRRSAFDRTGQRGNGAVLAALVQVQAISPLQSGRSAVLQVRDARRERSGEVVLFF